MKEMFYVVTWNFREDEAFRNYEDALACFNSKVGKVSYIELQEVRTYPLGRYASSLKIWHR